MLPLLTVALLVTPEAARDAERLVGILDYVAADYAAAVQDGQIINEDEFKEQLIFLGDARELATSLGQSDAELVALTRLVDAKVDPAEVEKPAKDLRDRLIQRLRVAVVPAAPASRERAKALFDRLCVECHGKDGMANTKRAKELKPPPAPFGNPKFVESLNPRRAYYALTFGLDGTAMASFVALTPEDRLALALYVFTFHHDSKPKRRVQVPLREIVLRSDAELRARVGEAGVTYLRTEGAWHAPDAITEARRMAREALAATSPEQARRLALDAYLSGFEGVEARLRSRDAGLVTQAERAFLAFRGALERADKAAAETELNRLEKLLDDAEARMADDTPRGIYAFFASLIIFLREGLEAALLIAALLAVLRRSQRADLSRVIHVGWTAALLAGLATWWLSSFVLGQITAQRETIEGIVSLLAAAVLFYVSFWLLSRIDSRKWLDYLRTKVTESLSTGSKLVLFGLAFLAVYREAFETVLFYRALFGEVDADYAAIVGGIVVGGAGVAVFVWAMMSAGLKLPLGAFFGVSGMLLCLLAVVFAGSGLQELREGGSLTARPFTGPEIPWLGVHPDWIGLAVQGVMLGVLVVAGLTALARSRSEADA